MKGETKMDLKSLITVAAVATAGAALAAYESPVKLCQIKVETASTNAIIALPLVNVGSTTVNPTNYVLTAGLTDGDILYASYGKGKAGWRVANGQWSGTPVIQGTNQSAPSDTLPRGTGVWLKRQSKTAPVYLYGQIATDAVTSVAAVNGFTMMGNPKTTSILINEITWTTYPTVGDEIEVLNDATAYGATTYVWHAPSDSDTPCWCTETLDTVNWTFTYTRADKTFQPGEGFWYKNTSSSVTPTINWGTGE